MKAGKIGKGDNCKVTNALPGAYGSGKNKGQAQSRA